MKKRGLFLVIGILFVAAMLIPLNGYCLYTGKTEPRETSYSPTHLIVKLESKAEKQVVLGKVGANITTGLPELDQLNVKYSVLEYVKVFREFKEALKSDKLGSVYVLEVPEGKGIDLNQMKKEYEGLSGIVEYAEPDYIVNLFDAPNDPLFPHQWYLNNTGQGYLGINRIPGDYNDTQVIKFGTVDADIDALEAWERNDQTTIPLVGIIDTGVDLDHEDLASNIWVNPGEDLNSNGIIDPSDINNTDDDHNGFKDDFYGWDFAGNTYTPTIEDSDPTDTYGHGTHCAGIVAAVTNNGLGVSGINTPCRIMAIKTFPDYIGGTRLSICAKGIVYAADMGCDIINMSWGSPYPSQIIKDALDYAVYRGVLPIAAAGNDGTEQYNYPASYGSVFTVGASNSHDQVTHFSTYSESLDVVAPGEDILSLRADTTDMYAEGGASGIEPNVHIVNQKYYLADGTSMAAPCAVGVAAYILAASPGISNDSVVSIIQRSADDILDPYGTGQNLVGKDIYSGWGRVNLNSALASISGRLAQITHPYENAIVSGNVAIVGTAAGANFQNYILQYGEGYSPTEWFPITSSTTPVINDTLGIWNSSGLTGLYTLRLTVGDQNQAVVHVIASNGVYVKITSPEQGDTVMGVVQVRGYTIAPDFSNYKLEYGSGESPSWWETITTSTKMVVDYTLGNWLTSFLDEGTYSLCLTVFTATEQTYADTVVVHVKSIVTDGWLQELSSYGSLSPAVGDVDGNGYVEIVVGVGDPFFGGTGGIEVFSDSGIREPGWPKDTDKNMMSCPALGDLDNDGINDIVICSNLGVHAYLSNPNSDGWFRPAGTEGNDMWSLATPVIADLENDGDLEVLTINSAGIVYAWRSDGQLVIPGNNGVFAQATRTDGLIDFPCLAVADLDQNGENEVIAGAAHATSGGFGHYTGEGGAYIWDINGNLMLGPQDYPDYKFTWVYGMAIANLDEDESLEVVVFAQNEDHPVLCAFNKDGTQVSGYPIVLEDLIAGWWFGNHPAVGDLDGDGTLEIAVTVWTIGEARLYVWHQDGIPLSSEGGKDFLVSSRSTNAQREKEALSSLGNTIGEIVAKLRGMTKEELVKLMSNLQEPPFASEDETFGSPVLADVNGDGNVDIIARAGYFLGSGYERVFAWDYQGNLINGFPLYASAEASMVNYYPYTPTIADMDKDGNLNMVLTTDWPNFKLVSWEFDLPYDTSSIPWSKYMHDKWNSGRAGFNPQVGGTPNIPPPNFHVESWTDSTVMLAWNPRAPWVSSGYNIYRSTVSGQPGEKINSTMIPQPQNQYQDVGLLTGEIYYYTITNVDTSYQESERSSEVAILLGQPTTPTGLAAEVVGHIVTLHWNQNPAGENVEKYIIYGKSPGQIDYQVIDSVAWTYYVDDSPKLLGIYSYRITAVNSFGLESFPSESLDVDIRTQLFDRTDYDVGRDPLSVFCADLDKDGDEDLAVANGASNNVSILMNNGNGTFQDRVDYGVGDCPRSVFCSDLDDDGDLDMVVANQYNSDVSVLMNDGNGTFQDRADYGTGYYPTSVFCADLDKDGDEDLAVANFMSANVSILMNNGNGTFQPKVNYNAGPNPRSVFCADLDKDGDEDLAVANGASNNVSILMNNGNGTFQDRVDYSVGSSPTSVFCADFDNDGDMDLAVANSSTANVSILMNNGNGTFQPKVNYNAGPNAYSVFCADLDNHNDLDLAVANGNSDNVSILVSDGQGGFQDKIDYGVGNYPTSVFCADLDNDNDLDLAVTNFHSHTVSILMNILVATDYVPGDVNMDDNVDIGDVVFLINYLFRSGPPPAIINAADVNGDCNVDIGDVVYLINYLFKGGNEPLRGCVSSMVQ